MFTSTSRVPQWNPELATFLECDFASKPVQRKQSPGHVKMLTPQIDSICTQGERKRHFKTAGKSHSGLTEFSSSSAGLSSLSVQEVKDELALKKILHYLISSHG